MTRRSSLPLPVAAVALASLLAALLVLVAAPARAATFSNSNPITVNDPNNGTICTTPPGIASPYPSVIAVSGLTGTVSKVTATLKNVSSTFAPDLDVLLVSPSGDALLLVSDAGGTSPGSVTNVTVTFDDAAATQLPSSPPSASWAAPNSTVTSRPVDYDVGVDVDVFPAPAPASYDVPAPAGTATLASAFNGSNPNGNWLLYAVDDGCAVGDVNTIAGGWSLDITTAVAAAPTTTSLVSSPNPSTTGQSVLFTATVTSGGSPVTTGTVTFSEGATVLAANVALNGGGQATFSTSTLTEGNHSIVATYNGTASFGTSNATLDHRVNNATTNPGPGVYCNTGPITLPSTAAVTPAVPYPSNLAVAGFVGDVGKVTVQLKNVTHGFSEDIDVLLVGPTGANLVLVSDAPRDVTRPVSNVSVTFDDAAASLLPAGSAWGAPNSSVTAKPTDYDPAAAVDAFPAPAPAPSANTTLAGAFNGTNPNGTWSLYVVDDGIGDAGSIAGGWCITLTAADTTPPSVTVERVGPDPTTGSTVDFTVTFSEPVTGFTAADVSLTGSTAAGVAVTNVTGGPSVYTVTVSGMTTSGLVVASVPAGGAVDAAGNANLASTSVDNSVLYKTLQSLPAVVTGSVNWKLRDILTSGPPTTTFTYGTKPLVPIMGDWDGNGTKTPGTFESGVFRLRNSNSAGAPDVQVTFGDPRGYPVVGDWNGDGVDDLAVFRAGVWQTRITGPGTVGSFSFGPALSWPTVVPVAGDWNGDGVDGIGTYNLFGGGPQSEWNLRQTASGGPAELTFVYGVAGQYPVTGDWNADGTDGVGTKVLAGTTWLLRNTPSAGPPDVTIDYGAADDLPLTWRK